MTVKSNVVPRKSSLDTPILSLFTLNWELVAYIILFGLAIFTRFYNLGDRVMSHDESLHTLYSWNLYAGKGYQHDPLMHGPFLFHINALMYFLFGDNDFTARISTALFGVVLVLLPYWFRPWLGRIGALAASVLILISPGLLYYSRYIRHDPFINVWTVLMVLAFFQYMRTRMNRWLIVGAAAVAFMLSTKEVAYIHGFIGITFILLAWLWENAAPATRRIIVLGGLVVLLVLAAVALYLTVNADALTVPASEGTEGSSPWHTIGLMIMVMGLLVGALLTRVGVDRSNRPVSAAIKSLRHRLPEVGKAALVAAVIFVLLYTTFFSNVAGLVSGTVGAVTYWLGQQEVQRGGQPWYYYLFLTPLYEFLPVLVGLIGGLVYLIRRRMPAHADSELTAAEEGETQLEAAGRPVWPSDGGLFASFTIYWAVLSFIIYSWAGEKMPWLTVHMTLPLVFLAAHVIQTVLHRFNWSEARQRGGLILGGALLLLIPALAALLTAQPFQSQSLQSINETVQFITALAVLVMLGAVIWRYSRRLGSSLAGRVAFNTTLVVLVLLTVRFSWLLSFVNYDYVNEILVYAHGGPDVKLALNQIEEISQRTVGDKMIKVAYDNDSTWPLEWYLREYPNRAYYGENPTRQALDAPVVIVGSANESKVKPFLGERYTRYSYRLVWWPVEDYKGQTLQKLWQNYVIGPPVENPDLDTAEAQAARRETVRDHWRKLWNIIFYRNYEDYDLNEWPYLHRFYVYIRKDVLNDMWDYQSGPLELTQAASLDPYQGKRLEEVTALQVWGSNGAGDGQFVTPRALAVGPDGLVYVADTGNNRIQVFDQSGAFLLKWGEAGAGPGQFNEPWGIAVAGDGVVYVADTWNHRVQAFSPTGEFLYTFGAFANVQQGDPQAQPGNFWGPRDVAVDEAGNVYVSDTGNKRVEKFTPEGEFLQAWGGGGIAPGAFEEPTGIDIDSQGNIFVADTWNRRIQKFDPDFNPLTQWEVVGWESESVVNKPGLALDPQDRVFISDPEGYRLIVYDNDGELLATWGQYGQDLASVALPIGLDFTDDGQLLVADADNNRVMTFAIPEFPEE